MFIRHRQDLALVHRLSSFNHIDFSHDGVPFESYLILLNLSQPRGRRRFFCHRFK